jgi:hypothetical protein
MKRVTIFTLPILFFVIISCKKDNEPITKQEINPKEETYQTEDTLFYKENHNFSGQYQHYRPTLPGNVTLLMNDTLTFTTFNYCSTDLYLNGCSFARIYTSEGDIHFELDFDKKRDWSATSLGFDFKLNFNIRTKAPIISNHSLGYTYHLENGSYIRNHDNSAIFIYHINDKDKASYYLECATKQVLECATPYYLNITSIDYANNCISGDFWFKGAALEDNNKKIDLKGSFTNLALDKVIYN